MQQLMLKMFEYYKGDAKRIQHFIKVHSLAKLLGEMEQLDDRTQNILETAALVHDIGIKLSEQKYNSSSGKYQELEGPKEARQLLASLNYPADRRERVEYLVGHHHTYKDIQGIDYQLLVEADFLVNLYEDAASEAAVRAAGEKIFKTASGKKIFAEMYAV